MAIGEILGFILENKMAFIEAYIVLIGLASVIIKLTPTLKDDHILKSIVRFTGKFVALNRK